MGVGRGRRIGARWPAVVVCVMVVSALSVGFTSGYFSGTSDGSLTVETAASFGGVTAVVDIKPESLQKKSEGQPVTAFVTLLDGALFADVDTASIILCLGTEPCTGDVPGDDVHKHDGDASFRVRFDRAAVIALVDAIQPPADVTFTVSGLVAETTFAGSDVVKLVDPGQDGGGDVETSPSPSPSVDPSPSADPSPTSDPSPSADPSPSVSPSDTLSTSVDPSPSA